MTFSWSPPAPTLCNGVITGYFLTCVPVASGGSTISMQYTAAGTFTLGGFTPATSYNCSISAINILGSGPVAYVVVTTLDDGECHKPVFCVILINFLILLTLHTCMCSWSALLSSNVVSAAAEWDWSERLSGMGCKYKFLIIKVKLLSMISNLIPCAEWCYTNKHDFYSQIISLCRVLLQTPS